MMRPRVRSYGDSSTSTLSPGRMRMKFFRIFPEMCARTWCLFSSSTLNIAFGSGSTTVAMTSIASSLDMASGAHGGGPHRGQAARSEDDRPVGLEGDRVFEVGRGRTVAGPNGPAVRVDRDLRASEIEHRLDRQHHARPQETPSARRSVVG